MTKLLSVLAVAAFLMVGGISSAQAHCGGCGTEAKAPCTTCVEAGKPCKCGDHAKKKAPCEKCMKAGKPCKCGGDKPCEKTLGENKKPCTKCAKGKMKHSTSASTKNVKTAPTVNSNIGSLQVQSRGSTNSQYND